MSRFLFVAAGACVFAGCASVVAPGASPPGTLRLACEGGGNLSVRLLGDEAHVGGLGGDALLHQLQPGQRVLRCRRP